MNYNRFTKPLPLLLIAALISSLTSCGGGGSNGGPVINPPGPPRLVPILTGLDNPLFVDNAGDGTNRLFIVEQAGRIKVLQPGTAAPSIFLDISSKVLSGGEQGLLGLAFHPQFATNRRFFVDYTRQSDGATVIAEYRQSGSNAAIANLGETILLTIPQPFANHNGGMLAFGKDGFLYIGMGDGGSANDPGNRAQNTDELLGKILRIDVDHAAGGLSYSSHVDNPYFGPIAGRDEIYAVGLRNPWRFSFDRLTGALYVGDVGQGAREEVDIVARGGNYGWRIREGTQCSGNDTTECGRADLVAPITDYDHSGGRCSITGGYVYRGARGTLTAGSYIFGDYCSGELFLYKNSVQSVLMNAGFPVSSFGEDESGEIYIVGLNGTVSRLDPGL